MKNIRIRIVVLIGIIAISCGVYLARMNDAAQNMKVQQVPRSSDSKIKILYPNGGESFATGDVVTLKSSGGYMGDMGMIENGYFLVDSSGKSKEISYSGNSYQWKIESYRDGSAIIPGTYKIAVTSSIMPCPNIECSRPIEDLSDASFTIKQGSTIPAPGTLTGRVEFDSSMNSYDAMLSINTRTEERDGSRGMPYTLRNIGIVIPDKDGKYTMNLLPGIYWIKLSRFNEPDNGKYFWPKVVGLPAFISIKSGESTMLNYSVDKSR